jgi:hypothetical protein
MENTVNLRNQIEIQKEGLDALVQRLGKVGAVRFLQLFNKNNGDSVEDKHERDAMLENMGVSFDDVLADMKKWEAENK